MQLGSGTVKSDLTEEHRMAYLDGVVHVWTGQGVSLTDDLALSILPIIYFVSDTSRDIYTDTIDRISPSPQEDRVIIWVTYTSA